MKIRILEAQVDSAAARRAAGFLEAFQANAVRHELYWEIEQSAWEAINKSFPNGAPRPLTVAAAPKAIPAKKIPIRWPKNAFGFAARAIKLMRTPEDAGVGDTIARVIGPVGGDAYKAWFLETFGKSCGCTERQEQLNETFPYEKTH